MTNEIKNHLITNYGVRRSGVGHRKRTPFIEVDKNRVIEIKSDEILIWNDKYITRRLRAIKERHNKKHHEK